MIKAIMPTYEYECKSCAYSFETFQSMNDAPLKDCPKCSGEIRRLIFGGAGVIFKGSGFYVTDKSGSGSKAPAADSGGNAACKGCAAKGDASQCPAEASKADKSQKT